MKILHVVTSVWRGGGGVSEVVPRLCRAQVALGHEVTLAVAKTETISREAELAIAAGVAYVAFPRLKVLGRLALSPEFRKGIGALISSADVVHIHGLWQAPVWYAAAACRRLHKRYLMMPHGFLEPERLKLSAGKKKLIARLIERRNLCSAAALVATSASEQDGIRRFGLSNPIHIMPIGLDLQPFQKPIPHAQKTLLYFSRITPIKGLDLLAEVWGSVDRQGWKLLIVGPDDRGYTEKMKALYAAKCAPGSYEFRDPVFGSAKYELLASVDAMILPTRSENWSIAVAEGMAAGLPVICTKGAPWECLVTAQAGYWVEISAAALRSAIEQLLALSDDERLAMGGRAHQWVKQNLSWDVIVQRLIRFYDIIYLR